MRIHSHPEYGFLEIYLPMSIERVTPAQARRLAGRLLTSANDLERDIKILEEEWGDIHGEEVIDDGDDVPATLIPDPVPKKAPGGSQT